MKGTWLRAVGLMMWPFLGPLGLYAQIEGPSLGLVLDPEVGVIRPILGIAGAARLGVPLDLQTPRVAEVAVSPNQDYILAISGEGEVVLVREASRSPTTSTIEGVWDGIDRIVLSPTGSAAGLIRDGLIQVITGLPQEPHVNRVEALPSVFGTLEVVAITDDARWLLAAFSDSRAAYLLDGGVVRPIGVFGHVSAMEFLHGRSDALIADDLYDEVYLVHDVSGLSGQTRLADSAAGVSGPVDVRASSDNEHFIVANGGSEEILLLSGAHFPVRIPCPCQPDQLVRLRGNAVFGLTGADGPMWVLVGDRNPPETFVIPAATGTEYAP